MIIFTPIKDIPNALLEDKKIKQVIKYNLSSYYSDIPSLGYLIPSSDFIPEDVLSGDCSDYQFDMNYHNYIMTNDNAFMQFMSIVVGEYMYPDMLIQILVDRSNYRDVLNESIMKLIQQRYGINTFYINDIEDFMYVNIQDLSIPGLFTIDQDMNRWRSMMFIEQEEEYE